MVILSTIAAAAITPDAIYAWIAALTALAGAAVAFWTRVRPMAQEAIELLRSAADAVGAHKDDVSVKDRVDQLGATLTARLDAQDQRLKVVEVRVAQLDCQEPECPSESAPAGEA